MTRRQTAPRESARSARVRRVPRRARARRSPEELLVEARVHWRRTCAGRPAPHRRAHRPACAAPRAPRRASATAATSPRPHPSHAETSRAFLCAGGPASVSPAMARRPLTGIGGVGRGPGPPLGAPFRTPGPGRERGCLDSADPSVPSSEVAFMDPCQHTLLPPMRITQVRAACKLPSSPRFAVCADKTPHPPARTGADARAMSLPNCAPCVFRDARRPCFARVAQLAPPTLSVLSRARARSYVAQRDSLQARCDFTTWGARVSA